MPCAFKVDRDIAAAAQQSAVEAGVEDVRVMHCADLEVANDDDDDDIIYSEKGQLALMDELPNLRTLLGDITDDRAAVSIMLQTLWQRLRPEIQFKHSDERGKENHRSRIVLVPAYIVHVNSLL